LLQVLENFIPPLLDAVLIDYQRTSVPSAREPEVLSAMGTIVNKLGGHITSEVPKIFDAVFECTLEMINKDFEEYPEHRTNFFLLLQVTREYSEISMFKLWFANFESQLNFQVLSDLYILLVIGEDGIIV
jgi:exportin-1